MLLAARGSLAVLFACTTALTAANAQTQIPLNSLEVRVDNFDYPGPQPGRWLNYRILGFRQPDNAGGAGVKPRMYLLPNLFVREDGVTFISEQGLPFTPTNCQDQPARSIVVRVNASATLPNAVQQVAVGAATRNTNAEAFIPPWPVQPNGFPAMWQPATAFPLIVQNIQQLHWGYSQQVQAQQGYVTRYHEFDTSFATLNELYLDLDVDGEIISRVKFDGSLVSSGGAPLQISVVQPDVYLCNRILSGNYGLKARYRFNDTGSATINARYNWQQSIRQFISETQRASSSSKSSGWRVLGFGNRRSRVKSSLDTNLDASGTNETLANTTIVTFDATDSMVDRFENAFLPALSKAQVISNHLNAAAAAEREGKPDLATIHRNYAAALTDGSEDLEVDAVGAAAALNEGDYATFLAKGVRMSSSSTSRTDNFRRVISTNFSEEVIREWNESRSVTKQREATTPVAILVGASMRPHVGIFSGSTFQFQFLQGGYQPQWVNRSGLLVGGLLPGGPLAAAGVEPGMVIVSINGINVTTLTDVGMALENMTPGSYIPVQTLQYAGAWVPPYPPQPGAYRTHNVQVGSRPAREEQQ